jgi:L-glyceraldehyde 3-phosphate reductase
MQIIPISFTHRFDPTLPLEETMGALASAVQRGKNLYRRLFYSAAKTREHRRSFGGWACPA